jgi:hypothetical protein
MPLLYEIILLFITALLAGTIGNLVGIGGGIIIMVVLLFVFKINPVVAGGLSLTTIVVSAFIGSLSNLRQNAIHKNLFFKIGVFAVAGSIVGSIMVYFVSTKPFEFLFGLIVICLGIFSVLATRKDIAKIPNLEKSFNMLSDSEKSYMKADPHDNIRIGTYSIIAGIVGGLLGLGIGAIMGTYLTAIKKVNPKIAFSTVLAAMVLTSIAGAILHFSVGNLTKNVVMYMIALSGGAAVGAIGGSYAASILKTGRLRFIQGYIILGIGLMDVILALVYV